MNKILKILLILSTSIALFSCSSDDSKDEPQEFIAKIECSNNFPAIGEVIDVKLTDIKGIATSIQWNWGDGTITQGSSSNHQYLENGDFTLVMTAQDDLGQTIASTEKMIVRGIGITDFVDNYNYQNMLIMAHRCNTGNESIPENSIAALEACIEYKEFIDFVEIDPRLTKDGVMIIMHDETVDRTTTGKGKVKDLTYDEIKKLKLKLSDGTVTDQSVPTLQDFLLKARGNIFVNLDFINKVSPKEIFELVQNCGMLDRVIFTVGTKKDVIETMLGYSKYIHLYGQYSNNGDENFFLSAGGGNRLKFVYITPAKALSTNYADILYDKKFIPGSQILDQNGFSYDSQMLNGNFTGINLFLEKKFLLLQTDYPKVLHDYLVTKNKR